MHDHSWQPIPNECRRYECACGVTGHKNDRGEIVEYKTKIKRMSQPTARTSAHGDWVRYRIKRDYDGT